ncbi:cyclin-dependent kinase protein [Carpediemonas membranifera]|uniref:non-specific serine/threonine protein kinase n=1 Tax=Carpediemonas membranifera TaxID=201153 RepID=A0A8J6EA54_9EUKA|nr:cyclin-dependent kinase protein [Carpediemonas membranifera]|eukprot:KAG9394240.1 cyclin-dependent kinase protein [Carpediemonas membranifera]
MRSKTTAAEPDLGEELTILCRICNKKIPIFDVEQHSKECYTKSVGSATKGKVSGENDALKPRTKKVTIEDFVPVGTISKGAFGTVFKVRKVDTGDYFALKVMQKARLIRKNQVDRVKGERDVIPRMSNTAAGHFIVRFFWTFQTNDYVFIVMEYLPTDLQHMLTMVGGLEESVVKQYVAELVVALEFCHSSGIVHRDIKPDNILIANDGHLRLIDFGLSSLGKNRDGPIDGHASSLFQDVTMIDEEDLTAETRKFSVVGTPEYLAPEVLLGEGHSYPVDWWALGVLMFEMLFGVPPFTAPDRDTIFELITSAQLEFPYGAELDASPTAMDLMTRLLDKNPGDRLGSVGDGQEIRAHPFFDGVNWGQLWSQQCGTRLPIPKQPESTANDMAQHEFDTTGWHMFLKDQSSPINSAVDGSFVVDGESLSLGAMGGDPFLNFQFSFTDYRGLMDLTIDQARLAQEAATHGLR